MLLSDAANAEEDFDVLEPRRAGVYGRAAYRRRLDLHGMPAHPLIGPLRVDSGIPGILLVSSTWADSLQGHRFGPKGALRVSPKRLPSQSARPSQSPKPPALDRTGLQVDRGYVDRRNMGSSVERGSPSLVRKPLRGDRDSHSLDKEPRSPAQARRSSRDLAFPSRRELSPQRGDGDDSTESTPLQRKPRRPHPARGSYRSATTPVANVRVAASVKRRGAGTSRKSALPPPRTIGCTSSWSSSTRPAS